MKKVLLGIAAAAMAVVSTGTGVSAESTESLFDSLRDEWVTVCADVQPQDPGNGNGNGGGGGGGDCTPVDNSAALLDFLLLANLDDTQDSCTGPLLTVFFPASLAATGLSATALAGLTEAKAQGIIGLHVTSGVYTASTLETGFFTELPNSDPKDPITITQDPLSAEGLEIVGSEAFCRGIIHYIGGIISTDAPAGNPSCGAALVPQCAPTTPAGSGSGLPATGSESMALTYAALASLIAGAGVLVLRRRSVA